MIDAPFILYHYMKMKYFLKFKSHHELENWHNKIIEKHLNDVVEKSKFYREYYSGHSLSNWGTLPIIDKAIMMDNFSDLNTVSIKKEEAFDVAIKAEKTRDFTPVIRNITVGLSSGTSGNRGIFLISPYEKRKWAGNILAKTLPGSLFQENRIAFFLRANSNLYTSIDKGKINFSFFDLLDDFDTHIHRLNILQPTVIVSPPSMLRMLAESIENRELKISPIKIISVAEVLEELEKNIIESAFKQRVHQVYQCTEGFIATTCNHGNMHLNEDLLVVQKEYIDKDRGKFVPIITDFSRKTQPIIRYRLNDILTENNEPCPCGSLFTRIDSIDGRQDDLFYAKLKTNDSNIPIFPDFIRRSILFSSNDISEYKVIQKSFTHIEVYLSGDYREVESVHENIRNQIAFLFEERKSHIPYISFHTYVKNTDKTVKLRRIVREFPLN